MDLSSVILGSVTTEKSERLKGQRVHSLRVHPRATKVDIRNALRTFFDADIRRIRVVSVRGKARMAGGGKTIQKRHFYKKAIITLAEKSKPLDIAAARSS